MSPFLSKHHINPCKNNDYTDCKMGGILLSQKLTIQKLGGKLHKPGALLPLDYCVASVPISLPPVSLPAVPPSHLLCHQLTHISSASYSRGDSRSDVFYFH